MTRAKRLPVIAVLIMTLIISSASTVFASAPVKEKVTYKGKGVVEVDFKGDVRYGKTRLTVKDSSGKKYNTSIIEKDDDEFKFRVKSYKTNKKYSFTITKIKKRGTSSYGTVKGSFKIPATVSKPVIKKTTYEGYGVAEVEFTTDVRYSGTKVTVKDSNGKSYSVRIIEKDDDELSFRIGSHIDGMDYSFTVSGIKRSGASSYTSVSGSFSIPSTDPESKITAEQAKEIALNDAVSRYSIEKTSARVFKCESDYDHGVMTWDVEFEAQVNDGTWYEFEYEINADGGSIIDYEKDFD